MIGLEHMISISLLDQTSLYHKPRRDNREEKESQGRTGPDIFFIFFLVIERVPLNHLVRAILAVAQPGDRGEALHAGLEGAVDGEVALVGLDGVPLGLPERSVPGRNKRPRPSISQRCHRGSRMRGAFSYKDGAVGEAMWSAQYARGAQWSELCFMYCAMFQ